MNKCWLFTDGSVNPQSMIGYGAYLLVPQPGLTLDAAKDLVKVKRFENTSSTKLELQTLLWALEDIKVTGRKLVIVSDSQNIMRLPGRRKRLEQNQYRSAANKPIINAKLYQEFYQRTDPLDYEFLKVRGHKLSDQKEKIDRLFTLVDRASRKALRQNDKS